MPNRPINIVGKVLEGSVSSKRQCVRQMDYRPRTQVVTGDTLDEHKSMDNMNGGYCSISMDDVHSISNINILGRQPLLQPTSADDVNRHSLVTVDNMVAAFMLSIVTLFLIGIRLQETNNQPYLFLQVA
ncbi:hypothetical protein Tco_0085380 [Tanacetum coccineum]